MAPVGAGLPRDCIGTTHETRIDGLELALTQTWAGWTSQLGLAVIDPRDRKTGHTLARRARRTLSLDLDRRLGQFNLGASWQAEQPHAVQL